MDSSRARDATCPTCQHRFETRRDRDAHVPCPDAGDERALRASVAELDAGATVVTTMDELREATLTDPV